MSADSESTPASSTPTTFIYALLDPRTREIRYIGKTDKLAARLRLHIRTRENTYKSHWIQSLVAKGLRPIMQIIDKVYVHEWQAAEAAYIIFFKEQGCNLTNATPGGDGLGSGQDNPQFRKPRTPEVKAKIRAKLMGHGVSAETRARMSAGIKGKCKGRKHSPEARARMSAAQKGKIISSETRAKLSALNKGKPSPQRGQKRSPELCAKLSAAHKGKPLSPKHRASLCIANKGERNGFFGKKHGPAAVSKMRAAKLGRTLSAETRARLVTAQRERRQREARSRHPSAGQLTLAL